MEIRTISAMFSSVGLVSFAVNIFPNPFSSPEKSPEASPESPYPTPLTTAFVRLNGATVARANPVPKFSGMPTPPLFTRLMLLNRILLIRFLLYLLPFIFL